MTALARNHLFIYVVPALSVLTVTWAVLKLLRGTVLVVGRVSVGEEWTAATAQDYEVRVDRLPGGEMT